jgi:hypothetical protein
LVFPKLSSSAKSVSAAIATALSRNELTGEAYLPSFAGQADKSSHGEQRMEGGHRRGPKPQGPFEYKRRMLTTRITDDIRTKLDAAARAAGRSLSQEVEMRLESSFQAAGQLREALELSLGPQVAALVLMMGLAMRDTARWPGRPFSPVKLLSEPFLFARAAEAAAKVIDCVKPDGDPDALLFADIEGAPPEMIEQWTNLGRDVGAQVCLEIARYPHRLGPWTSTIRDWLGPDAVQRIEAKAAAAFHGAP